MAGNFPRHVQVQEIVSSRYPDHCRPLSWDRRKAGRDVIKTNEGELLTLQSDGQQSPPHPGWVILLTGQSGTDAYTWTLYGIPKIEHSASAH